MSQIPKTHWYNSYQYVGRDLKLLWTRNGGKICTIAGTTGLFLTSAHACRKTYKIHDKLKGNGNYISEVKEKYKNEKWYKRVAKTAGAYIYCSAKTTKDYLPDIVGGALSAYCVTKGWGIEHTNYKNATAMAGIIAGSFMNYRQNVIAEHGVEADRRYLTTKHTDKKALGLLNADQSNDGENKESASENNGLVVQLNQNALRILYSKETTPQVWSPSHTIRMQQLDTITSKLNTLLICGGHYTINDVRREFYGVKGDIKVGAMFGRVWDPGNPAHPERGAKVNLHYEDDEDFKYGLKDSCWIIIDIDDEPLIESLGEGNTINDIPGVEV